MPNFRARYVVRNPPFSGLCAARNQKQLMWLKPAAPLRVAILTAIVTTSPPGVASCCIHVWAYSD
ncbi:MAG TPA: hypothetical protein VNX66_12405 [Candidatus Sulfotelmatobacter sp.]|nr:hypothetical protein [Candidatus Sulfotelmatobacter sp.]